MIQEWNIASDTHLTIERPVSQFQVYCEKFEIHEIHADFISNDSSSCSQRIIVTV